MITNWTISNEEHDLLMQVVDRAMRELEGYPDQPRTLMMDLMACYANGCPLDFAGLLTAPMQDFSHDIYGIRKAIDRSTGKLTEDAFMPRYALANRTGTTSETETFDLTPAGCQTPEGIARVNAAMKAFEDSHAEVANAATQFIDDWRITIMQWAGSEHPDLREDLHQLEALIGARRRKHDAFARAVVGAPPAQE